MTIPVHRFAAVCAGALVFAALATGAVRAQDDALPEAPGKDVVATTCTQCHSTGVITARRRSPQEWSGIVSQMESMGAVIDPEHEKTIIAYLSANLGAAAAPTAEAGASAATPADPAAPPAQPAPTAPQK